MFASAMSKDKKKLHDRAMKLLKQIGHGRGYCTMGGLGPSKELEYLLKKKYATLMRSDGGGTSRRTRIVELDSSPYKVIRSYTPPEPEEPGLEPGDCECYICDKQRLGDSYKTVGLYKMYVCKTCGNKRCPRAAFHGNVCNNSNNPDQPGSLYGPGPLIKGFDFMPHKKPAHFNMDPELRRARNLYYKETGAHAKTRVSRGEIASLMDSLSDDIEKELAAIDTAFNNWDDGTVHRLRMELPGKIKDVLAMYRLRRKQLNGQG